MPLIYGSVIKFLMDRLDPEEILAFKASPKDQERVDELLDRNNAGTITPEEYAELQQAVAIERLFMVLKAHALEQTD